MFATCLLHNFHFHHDVNNVNFNFSNICVQNHEYHTNSAKSFSSISPTLKFEKNVQASLPAPTGAIHDFNPAQRVASDSDATTATKNELTEPEQERSSGELAPTTQ